MNIEALKQQLAEGKITPEQFAAEVAKLLAAGTITQEEHDAAIKPEGDGGQGGEAFTDAQLLAIQKMVQSAGDTVRTKAAQEKKLLEDQLEALETAKMTEEQRAKHELEKLQKQNIETAAELLKEKVGFHTVKVLTAKVLPIEFGDFLVGDSIETTDSNIAVFETAWQAAIKAAVDAKFAAGGGDPLKDKGGAGAGANKTWKEMTPDEQGKVFREDPARARVLAKAAGYNL